MKVLAQAKHISQTEDDLVEDLQEVDPDQNGQNRLVGLAADTPVLPVSATQDPAKASAQTHVFLSQLDSLLSEHLEPDIAVQVTAIPLGLLDVDVIMVLSVGLEPVVDVVRHVWESPVGVLRVGRSSEIY